MRNPETRYAKGRGGFVAYQVFGDGPLDLVFITDWVTNIEVMWEEPSLARFFRRLASFSRVICFDKRGTGVSDPVLFEEGFPVETWVDDTCTVLQAVGSQRAVMFGHAEGGRMAMLFAATFPEKTSALILLDSFARRVRDNDYPWGVPEELVPTFCFRISSAPPNVRRNSATGRGPICWRAITMWRAARSRNSEAVRSTPPATASSPLSMDRRERSAAPVRSATPPRTSGSPFAPACTPASVKKSATR
jgi:pimeloyl-ACP methyl ester carboxylesterase